jgi:hypothetical protein
MGDCSVLFVTVIIVIIAVLMNTYDHRSVKTGHPVRSAIHKH